MFMVFVTSVCLFCSRCMFCMPLRLLHLHTPVLLLSVRNFGEQSSLGMFPTYDTMQMFALAVVLGLFVPRTVLAELIFEAYTDANAVCTDGSPSGLYFQKATKASQKDVWVVQMQGGPWCWDAHSCSLRAGSLISSKNWPKSRQTFRGSILDATGTDFEHANKAFQAYCTSDGYIGNTSFNNMQFRGHVVVMNMLSTLKKKGLGANGNATLIFSGCSAGGRGVMYNLNRVAEISSLVFGVARFVGLIDSGLYIDTDPLATSSVAPLRVQAQGVVRNLKAVVDPTCAAKYPSETWKCLIGEYAVPTLTAPFVLHAFQADRFQLGFTAFGNWFLSVKQIRHNKVYSDYAQNWRTRTRASLFAAVQTHGKNVAIHSSDCYSYCNTAGSRFSFTSKESGESLKSVVQAFVFGTPGRTVKIDNCTGVFACGAKDWCSHVAKIGETN